MLRDVIALTTEFAGYADWRVNWQFKIFVPEDNLHGQILLQNIDLPDYVSTSRPSDTEMLFAAKEYGAVHWCSVIFPGLLEVRSFTQRHGAQNPGMGPAGRYYPGIAMPDYNIAAGGVPNSLTASIIQDIRAYLDRVPAAAAPAVAAGPGGQPTVGEAIEGIRLLLSESLNIKPGHVQHIGRRLTDSGKVKPNWVLSGVNTAIPITQMYEAYDIAKPTL
jgi:hypothetical protein